MKTVTTTLAVPVGSTADAIHKFLFDAKPEAWHRYIIGDVAVFVIECNEADEENAVLESLEGVLPTGTEMVWVTS